MHRRGDRPDSGGVTGYITRFDKLVRGVVASRPAFIPTGNSGREHIRPEDTPDADYGRLLERAQRSHGKGVRPHRESMGKGIEFSRVFAA